MERYICIHAHFYQPPRENPWLEDVQIQDSAYPYHDWNEKITAECYEANSASRILNDNGKIIDILNNYTKISFNFGPTLLSWMDKKKNELYKKIIESDIESRRNFGGFGSAIAQCYNHIIMPLANEKTKRTQIIWGTKDFYHRFKRLPMGMWLPETAVDIETLMILSENGIRFTILSPYQAKMVRRIGEEKWIDVSGGRIDTKRAYLCRLPDDKTINIFFYDKDISHDVAFGGLLKNGENFAKRLLSSFSNSDEPQIVNIATDGETYGHHHKYGDMALSYCINYIEKTKSAKLTNYSEFLNKFPPEYEVRIIENTSWSCSHGIERWREDCGCSTGSHPGWNQKWRKPLRIALDNLKEELDKIYIEKIKEFTQSPFELLNYYIDYFMGNESFENLISRYIKRDINEEERIKILKLLEMERMSNFMFTSCGWFFDDISNIETQQILLYAKRGIQLAEELNGNRIEENFINSLKDAKSNIIDLKDGENIYKKLIIPQALNLEKVAAHYVISNTFNLKANKELYFYSIDSFSSEEYLSGITKLINGEIRIKSERTREVKDFYYSVFHLGDQNVICGITEKHKINLDSLTKLTESFKKGEITNLIRDMDKIFNEHIYTLINLFKDEQRKIIDTILKETYKDIKFSLIEFYEKNSGILNFLFETKTPFPKIIRDSIEYVLNIKAYDVLNSNEDPYILERVIEELKRMEMNIDKTTIGFLLTEKINKLFDELWKQPHNIDIISKIEGYLKISKSNIIELNLWKAQNKYFYLGEKYYSEISERAEKGDEVSKKWLEIFEKLMDYLYIHLEEE